MSTPAGFRWALTRKVQYYETDKMAVVHHSNYIRWMEEARVEYSALNGIPYDQLEADGILMPVLEIHCQYRTSMMFGQTAQIYTRIASLSATRMSYEYEIHCMETGALVLQGSSHHCFIDEKSRYPLNAKKHQPVFYQEALLLLEADSKEKGENKT